MSEPLSQAQLEAKTLRNGRVLAILLLLFEVGIMFAYGFGGEFKVEANTTPITGGTAYLDHADKLILYTFTALLAILGYGLLVAYSQNSAIAGLTTTLLVVAVSVQLSPLLLSFWEQVFAGFAKNAVLSLQTERETMALCTSLLAALCCLVGRLGAIETFVVTAVYNVGWTLSYKVTEYLQSTKGPSGSTLYDDNGTNYVYVFAGFFALITSVLLNLNKGPASPQGSRHSAYISMIGTGFIFAAFPFTGVFYPSVAVANTYRQFHAPLNIYFTLTASVISTYVFSAIFGNFKIGVRESLLGVLSGGVTVSVVAGTLNNIGACIAIGGFSGLVSGFWLKVVHPRINKQATYDHLGIWGPILICSVIGGLGLSPAMYQVYWNRDTMSAAMGTGVKIDNDLQIQYQLVYIGVAAGTGMMAGLIAGLLSLIWRNPKDDFEFSKLVSSDFGLYSDDKQNAYKEQNNETNNQLRHDAQL